MTWSDSKTVISGPTPQTTTYSSDNILFLWCLSLWLPDQPCISQREFSRLPGWPAGLFGGRRGSVGEDRCRIWVGWLWSSSGRCRGGKFRSAPSRQAPRRTLAPAFPRYLEVLHRHWLSPPWSGSGPPGVHTADQSEWQTDASLGGPRPVAESETHTGNQPMS